MGQLHMCGAHASQVFGCSSSVSGMQAQTKLCLPTCSLAPAAAAEAIMLSSRPAPAAAPPSTAPAHARWGWHTPECAGHCVWHYAAYTLHRRQWHSMGADRVTCGAGAAMPAGSLTQVTNAGHATGSSYRFPCAHPAHFCRLITGGRGTRPSACRWASVLRAAAAAAEA